MNQISINSSIILELAKASTHGRDLAKRLGKSQPTIARRLREMEAAGLLLSREEGKNRTYSLTETYRTRHALAAAEHEKAAHFLMTHPREAALFTSLLKRTGATIILLFGSYAKGKERVGSDYDLYMDITREERDALAQLHSKLRIQAGSFETSTATAQEIIRNHVILKGVDGFLAHTRPESAWQALDR